MHRKEVAFRLGAEDVSSIRFATSPGHELCSAVRALQVPGGQPLHWGWMREAAPEVDPRIWRLFTDLIGPRAYFPDFLSADPAPDLSPTDQVARLRAVPDDQIRVDLGKMVDRADGDRRARLLALHADPPAARERIAAAWPGLWDALLARYWPAVRRLLLADVTRRARDAAADGLAAMVARLHERVAWHGDAVTVRMQHWSEELDCRGSGLLLVPTVLGAPHCSVLTEPTVAPTLFYPAAGVSEEWYRSAAGGLAALTVLIGGGRTRLLVALDRPRTTSGAATAAGLAVSTASLHLDRLHAAGLVDRRRAGREVHHHRTALGDALIHPTRG